MAYWIQEVGGSGKNSSGYRLFYCETDADIADLPTATTEGARQEGDSVSCKPCAVGSEALVRSTGDVYVLTKSTNSWEKIGG